MQQTRPATPADAAAIAEIYNVGIASGQATFETAMRTPGAIREWLAEGWPVMVAEDADGQVVAWASASPSSPRKAYEGVRDFSVYVAPAARRGGYGRAVMQALIDHVNAEQPTIYKLTSKVFVDNAASRELLRSLGFREVGTHVRHGRIGGEWRDVVVVELLVGDARVSD